MGLGLQRTILKLKNIQMKIDVRIFPFQKSLSELERLK